MLWKIEKIYVETVDEVLVNKDDEPSGFYLTPYYTGYRSAEKLEFKLENKYFDKGLDSSSPILLNTLDIDSLNDFNLDYYIKFLRDKKPNEK